jgi:hypothetical protein
MKPCLSSSLLALVIAGLLASGLAHAEGASNARERFLLKRHDCKWTDEMGKYIYDCVKANFGFNAHWCHNEAMEVFCPVDESAVPGPAAAATAPAAAVPEPAAATAPATAVPANQADWEAASRQGEESLKGSIEREQTMLKYKDCKWTDEMGKFVYECVKRQNGFGVHWCHDEALQTMCPAPKG